MDVFEFSTETWYTLPDSLHIPTPRAGTIAVNCENKLLIAGGEIADSAQALGATEVFDPALQKWETWPDLNHPRHGTQGIVSGDGVYVIAGSPTSGGGRQKNMEFLGADNPMGEAITASSLDAPDLFNVENRSASLVVKVKDGNQGLFIRSMTITGPDAAEFVHDSEGLQNVLISQDSSLSISINYLGEKTEASAILSINYGDSAVKEIELKASEQASGFSFNLNTGHQPNISYDGDVFIGEGKSATFYSSSNTNANPSADQDSLFHSERYGSKLSYAIPVPNGLYTVRTYHNELWFGKNGPNAEAGQRVFDIFLEEVLVKKDLDLFVESGNLPLVLTFEGILVTDGLLNLDMLASAHNASISGIAIVSEFPTSLEPGQTAGGEEMVISLYPNPADTETILSLKAGVRLDHILIHNMSGQLIHQLDPPEKGDDGNYLISLGRVSPGVYLISLVGDKDLIKQLRLVVNP